MECQRCKEAKVIEVSGKTSDMCFIRFVDKERDHYVPEGIGITDGEGGGDYITFDYCFGCGQIQGKFPIDQEAINKVFDTEGEAV